MNFEEETGGDVGNTFDRRRDKEGGGDRTVNIAEEMLSGMGVGFATERDRLRVASILTGLLRDKECLDWLEENVDQIEIDHRATSPSRHIDVRVYMTFVSKESGKLVTIYGRSLRDVAAEALRD